MGTAQVALCLPSTENIPSFIFKCFNWNRIYYSSFPLCWAMRSHLQALFRTLNIAFSGCILYSPHREFLLSCLLAFSLSLGKKDFNVLLVTEHKIIGYAMCSLLYIIYKLISIIVYNQNKSIYYKSIINFCFINIMKIINIIIHNRNTWSYI